jgi:hypothetical protein
MFGKETSHLKGGMPLVAFYQISDNNVITTYTVRHDERLSWARVLLSLEKDLSSDFCHDFIGRNPK